MMRFFITAFVIYQLTLASAVEKFQFHQHEIPKRDEFETLRGLETRYQDYPDRDYRHYNSRKDFDLPITFKAPNYEAHDYWREKQGYDNRRTFFDDYSYKTTAFPGFYQFMTSIFGGREDATPEPPERYYPRNHPTPPYSYNPQFNFRPTEPNYIPPPKPIRASVIKLETITRSPIYPSEYETTPKYYPHPGTLLNHVLIENSKAEIPPFKPLPVLPKPVHLPTTLKPNYPFYNNHTLLKYYNGTDYKYPESVQDQLPYFNQEEVKIPYVSEKPIPQIFNTLPPQNPTGFVFPSNSRATTNIIDLIDIRSLNPSGNRQERPEFETTTVKSFPGAVEKVKRPVFKYTKKLTAQLDKNSVERVANLTVQGFSKSDKENINHHVNYLNVRNLINYEMKRLENFTDSKLSNDSAKRPVNLNDELSLDAKILKDTNWDGLTVLPTSTTEETTTIQTTKSTAFWEIVGQTTTEVITTAEQTKTRATEFPSTTELTETTTTTTTTATEEGISSTEESHRRLENVPQKITENPEIDTVTPSEKTTSARRYSRRPKVVSFTPYPTAEEIQKKLINRNNFPKRQKPNITIAFGNKNVLKNRSTLGKEEVMKFSDEEVRRRRKIGKRRQVFKRVRVVTTEQPLEN